MARLEEIDLPRLQVLERDDAPAEWVYFPLDCVLSLSKVMRDGRAVQIGTIGREGATASSFLAAPLGRLAVQTPGRGFKMAAAPFREALRSSPEISACCERYAQALIAQIIQSAACSQLHSAFERCARSILAMRDRQGASSFTVTHEHLAEMLGVRRATVTEAAQQLKELGAISYRRGRVVIADVAALERASCECHGAIAAAYERLLGG